MAIKFIVNDRVMFIPKMRKLVPLTSSGKETLLNVPVCRVFISLIESRGIVVSHEMLMEQVWGANKQIVTMNTLYQNISLLRRCLKKSGVSPKSVRTYSKVGFSFCGEIQIIEDESLLEEKQEADQTTTEYDSIIINKGNGITFIRSITRFFKKIKRFVPHFYYISILICVIGFLAYKEILSMKFTVEQVKVARFNNCPVYLDKGNQNVDIDKIVKFLKTNGVSCSADQYVYLTKNFYIDGITVFKCGLSSDNALVCSSEVELPGHLQI